MRNYSKAISNQPQTQPIIGRDDMVKNSAGGYVFQVSDQEQLERFLLLGAEGGTYYAKEQELVVANAKSIIKLIQKDGVTVVQTVVDFAMNRKAPRADAGIFVLALVTKYGDAQAKKLAYNSIVRVCNTATQLFTFLGNIKNLRGWSRGLRKGVANWYETKDEKNLSYQLVKYRQRNGYTHRDALRLSHPKIKDTRINSLLSYAVGKTEGLNVDNELIQTFTMAQSVKEGKDLISLINAGGLTWEMIPTELLNDKSVLEALLNFMPLTALIRNVNRYSYNGMTEGLNDTVKKIVARFGNKEEITKARIHPVMVINSMKTYLQGHGDKGSKTWKANQRIVDAMVGMYETAVSAVESTNKNILIGVDVSGSMSTAVSGMTMSASQIAQVLAVTILKSENNADMVWFDTNIRPATFGKRTAIDDVLKHAPNGGGTDCAQPILLALKNKLQLDAIIILTDNETWAGSTHAKTALDTYRKTINPNIKVIEVALVSNPHTNFPADDKNILRVVGFDNSVIELINKFIA